MQSARKALRDGSIDKDSYGRLRCGECGTSLGTDDPDEEIYTIRRCPDCDGEWKELP